MPHSLLAILTLILSVSCNKDATDNRTVNTSEHIKVAFYNVQNLFDTLDDADKDDAEYLPAATKQWNTIKYEDKLDKLSKVILEMNAHAVGLCEIENTNVLNSLMAKLGTAWKYVHYESEDARGIDVALVYNSTKLNILTSTPYKVEVTNEPNYKTRDLLKVQAVAKQDTLNFIVCHYHSRLNGIAESKHYRIAASDKVNEIVSGLPESQLTVVMGDFNANPSDEPVTILTSLTNPAKKVDLSKEGSLPYTGQWQLYDQILYYNPGKYQFQTFTIFHPVWLTNQTGLYKDYPFRTYAGDKYLGGYSDHFPVYIEFNY